VTILIGALAGWLGSVVFRGRGYGLVGNIIVGIAGGFVGYWLLGKIGIFLGGWLGAILTGAIGAVVILFLFHLIFRG